jgi:hypothetical protein
MPGLNPTVTFSTCPASSPFTCTSSLISTIPTTSYQRPQCN